MVKVEISKELLEDDCAYTKNDRIEINGNCYLEDDGKWIRSPDVETYCARSFEVPEDSYYLLGDNREIS